MTTTTRQVAVVINGPRSPTDKLSVVVLYFRHPGAPFLCRDRHLVSFAIRFGSILGDWF